MKRASDHTLRLAVMTVATFGLVIAAVAATTARVVAEMARLSPEVGDIVAFHPGPLVSPDLKAVVGARLVHGGRCELDTEVLAADGGSLVVVAKRADGLVRADWAGGATARGAASCGRDSELLLLRQAVKWLALSAGGFGVTDKMPVFFASSWLVNTDP